jgi:hypothetical protein
MNNRLSLPISLPSNLSRWKLHHYNLATILVNKLLNDEVSDNFKNIFHYESIKIGYNENTDFIYLYDNIVNYAMIYNNRIELVDEFGNIKEIQSEDKNCMRFFYSLGLSKT